MPSPFVRPSSGNSCKVTLPDGSSLLLTVNRNLTGAELVNKICEQLDIQERNYFSCTYGKRQKWLNKVKQVRRQVRGKLWLVTFKVKLYPPAWLLDSLSNPMRCHLFSQLTSEVATGKLPCSFDTLSCLGSYVVQSLLGDYDERTHGSGIDYIRQIAFGPNQGDELLDEIAQRHQSLNGLPTYQAQLVYLQKVMAMAWYGVHLYGAKNTQCESLAVGVSSAGMVVMKGSVRLQHLTWTRIIAFNYRGDKFTAKIRLLDPYSAEAKLKMCTPQAKQLFIMASEHHQLFRVRLNEKKSTTDTVYQNISYRVERVASDRRFETVSPGTLSVSIDDLQRFRHRQHPQQQQYHSYDNIVAPPPTYESLPAAAARQDKVSIYTELVKVTQAAGGLDPVYANVSVAAKG